MINCVALTIHERLVFVLFNSLDFLTYIFLCFIRQFVAGLCRKGSNMVSFRKGAQFCWIS